MIARLILHISGCFVNSVPLCSATQTLGEGTARRADRFREATSFDEDIHLHGALAAKHRGEHSYTVFRKSVWQIAPVASASLL